MPERRPDAELLVRACWDLGLRVAPAAPVVSVGALPSMPPAPVLERASTGRSTLHLPWLCRAGEPDDLTLAAAMHAAAHLRFGDSRTGRSGLKPVQQVILGLLEDARIERLARRLLPGLRNLWMSFHHADETAGATVEALLRRLTRALSDTAYEDEHPWIVKARRLSLPVLDALERGEPPARSLREVASLLGNDLGQMRLQFNPRAYVPWPRYRDDNAHLWETEEAHPEEAQSLQSELGYERVEEAPLQVERTPSSDRPSVEPSPADSRDTGAQATVVTPMPVPVARLAGTVQEWDHLCGRYRPDWCRIYEELPPDGDPEVFRGLIHASSRWISQAASLLRAARSRGGSTAAATDGIDLSSDGLTAAGLALRLRQPPDPRVYRAPLPTQAFFHVHFLLDTSVSTGAAVSNDGHQVSALDAMRSGVVLACAALEEAGHRCSVTGFCSNTRDFVRLQTIKTAGEPIASGPVLSRLAGLHAEWSTRTGAALRYLATQAGDRRMKQYLVLVSDGEPHDIDCHDPRYLRADLARSLADVRRRGHSVLSMQCGGEDMHPAGARQGSAGMAFADAPTRLASRLVLELAGQNRS